MVEFEKNITSNESLKLFESVWQESIDGMRIIDENGIMILVNNAFCQLVDFSEEELTGKPMSVIYAESSKESILDHAKERIRTGTVIRRIERELTLHNGKKVWFELSNSEIKNDDGSKYILSIFRDISKQKLSQIKLEESEERFRKIFYESTDPL
nr:PAS domain S-box protein [Ignavibacteriaceae bacterium]